MPAPQPKAPTFSTSRMLTPSEVELLLRASKQTGDYARRKPDGRRESIPASDQTAERFFRHSSGAALTRARQQNLTTAADVVSSSMVSSLNVRAAWPLKTAPRNSSCTSLQWWSVVRPTPSLRQMP